MFCALLSNIKINQFIFRAPARSTNTGEKQEVIMLNQVTIMGRVVTAPTTRKAGKDHVVCDFSVAVDRDYKDADGNYPTDFFRVTAWDGTAEFIANYFADIGTPLIITGRLILNQWETEEGEKRQNVLIQAEHVYFAERKPKEEKADSKQRKNYGKR